MGLFRDLYDMVSSSKKTGGMRVKYARLLEHILEGHPDSKIFLETRTYIRAGVSNYGGTTMFHIQQNAGGTVSIDYEVSNNPAMKNFTLHFTFPDTMNQDEMMIRISEDVQNKMAQMFSL